MLGGGAEAWPSLSTNRPKTNSRGLRIGTEMSGNRGGISLSALVLTVGLDFWEDLSRTSSKDRSESSEKLRFWLAFRSGRKAAVSES